MAYWCDIVVLCLHVASSVARADLQQYTRQPFGPAMCEMLCRQTVGCSDFSFSESHLTCQIKSKAIPHHDTEVHEATKAQRNWTTPTGIECPPFSRLIITRTKNVQCVLGTDSQEYVQLFKEGGKKILFLPITHAKSDLNVMLPHNRSVSRYRNMQLQSVQAIAYLETKRWLMVSTHREILSYTEENINPTRYWSYSALAIVVDQPRILLFMFCELSPTTGYVVFRMNSTGNNTIIFMSATRPRAITINPKVQRVYVCFDDELTSFSYNGSNVRPVAKGAIIDSVTADPLGEALYYISHKYLYQYSFTKETLIKLKYVREKFHQLHLYGSNVLLLTVKERNTIFAMDLLNLDTKLQTVVVAEGTANGTAMCLIP